MNKDSMTKCDILRGMYAYQKKYSIIPIFWISSLPKDTES